MYFLYELLSYLSESSKNVENYSVHLLNGVYEKKHQLISNTFLIIN